jgi:zinc/manganese transport system permease protein
MLILIEAVAAASAAAALLHAYLHAQSLLFWPLVSLVLSAAVLAALSPLAVSRRMTFLAHAQGHSILTAALAAAIPAAVAARSLDSPLFYLATLLFVIVLNLLVLFTERLGFRKDVATGVVMSFQLTATVVLLYVIRYLYATALDPLSIITGEYVLITYRDVLTQTPLLFASALFPLLYGVKYLYAAVDEAFAQAVGINPKLLDRLFVVAMSLAVAASVYALGSLMPAVLLVLPGAAASRYSHRLTEQIPLSVSLAVLSAAVAHFLYTMLPWLWPSAALGLALLALLVAAQPLRNNASRKTAHVAASGAPDGVQVAAHAEVHKRVASPIRHSHLLKLCVQISHLA